MQIISTFRVMTNISNFSSRSTSGSVIDETEMVEIMEVPFESLLPSLYVQAIFLLPDWLLP